MSRSAEIERRIGNVRQIETIVSTLRALAASYQVEARHRVEAIRANEAIVAEVLSQIIAMTAERPSAKPASRPSLLIVVGAGQGFCGAYGERLAEVAVEADDAGSPLMVVGARTIAALHGVTRPPVWTSDMVPRSGDIPALASRLADALFDFIGHEADIGARICFADPSGRGQPLLRRTLFPFDMSRFPPVQGNAPLLTLPPSAMISLLVEEYVFAELCEALMLGLSAENAARADAMGRAQTNIERIATELRGEFRSVRQEEMTAEILELVAGREFDIARRDED